MAEAQQEKKNLDLTLLGWVLGKARPYKSLFIFTLVVAVVLAPVSTIRPYLIKEMVDNYIMVNDLSGLRMMALIYVGFVLANAILRYFFVYCAALLV